MNAAAQASALAERISKASLSREALDCLEQSDGPWVLGCSGGADSVCLAFLIKEYFPERQCILAHFNHKLRGAASDADALFVQELADALGFECIVRCAERSNVGGSDASEAVLRAERFAFFESILSERNARMLLLAHQADDVAETLLMRIARGSGLSGLCAPRPVHTHGSSHVRVRPLLTTARETIEAALKELGIAWRQDASNFSDDYFRNRIRHRVLPLLKDAAPTRLLPSVLHTRSLLDEDDCALEAWVDTCWGDSVTQNPFDAGSLSDKPRAIARRVLYRWLCAHGLSLTRVLFETILNALTEGQSGMWSAAPGKLVVFKEHRLSLECAATQNMSWLPRGFLIDGGRIAFPDGSFLSAECVELTQERFSKIAEGGVDPKTEAFLAPISGVLLVRKQRAGDRFHPLGAPGSKTLQDCFIDKKIPADTRAQLPVVFSEAGEVLWCPGFPPSEKSRLGSQMSYALRLTYVSPGC